MSNLTDADLYALAERLYPIPRCLMGAAVEETLDVIAAFINSPTGSELASDAVPETINAPGMTFRSAPSGTKVFDWTVPAEWIFHSAWIEQVGGAACGMKLGPEHVVRYSAPVGAQLDAARRGSVVLSYAELAAHVHTLPHLPRAVPYRTAYYNCDTWGLCLPHAEWSKMPESDYQVVIDAERKPGHLTWGECVIPGESSKEILLSTYICHPSLANDNVSGMVVTAALAKWLASAPRRYAYRVLFAPETIGALAWLSDQASACPQHSAANICPACVGDPHGLAELRGRIVAGYTINCCGDERAWSFLPSRKGDTLADRAARHTLNHVLADRQASLDTLAAIGGLFGSSRAPRAWREYSFADRGSDERQFCAPGVDLPIASVMRSKHGTFPEYHTTADDLSVISAKGLGDSFRCYQRIIETIEANRVYRCTTIGEPMLSKYGLYPQSGGPDERAKIARDLCAYADGETDLIAIAGATGRAVWEIAPVVISLQNAGLFDPAAP